MRNAIIILTLGFAICLGLLAYQHYSNAARYERQNQAIALMQKKYEAALRQNQAFQERAQIQERSRIAFSQAQRIVARYQRFSQSRNPAPAR
jgi:hypothetical protein